MSGEPERITGRSTRYVVFAVVLVALYPLSIGPAAWAVTRIDPNLDGIPSWLYFKCYKLIEFAAPQLGLQEYLRDYTQWFVDL